MICWSCSGVNGATAILSDVEGWDGGTEIDADDLEVILRWRNGNVSGVMTEDGVGSKDRGEVGSW
jgi:hypothetical protein